MEEILPNLFPAVFTLVFWLASSLFKDDRLGLAFSRGFFAAFILTFVLAVPPFLLAYSNDFKGLGMVWMLTFIMAVGSAALGLVAFAIGFGVAWSSTGEKDVANDRSDPPEDEH